MVGQRDPFVQYVDLGEKIFSLETLKYKLRVKRSSGIEALGNMRTGTKMELCVGK